MSTEADAFYAASTSQAGAGLLDDVLQRIEEGQRFAGLFGTQTPHGVRLTALLAGDNGIEPVDEVLVPDASGYEALSPMVTAAHWYEREIYDAFGLDPVGHPGLQPLVLPLTEPHARPRPGAPEQPAALQPDERVLPSRVTGPGIFTIPHGPVRSGVMESVEYLVETPGEGIPQVHIRVFGKHRGLEKRFEGLDAVTGVLLAERVEGIATVAHALAYSHAVESLCDVSVPPAAAWVRLLYAELERIANHLDVAIRLCDAAGLAVATARFGWHKERVLRCVSALCGSRFGRGVVVPGGVRCLPALSAGQLRDALDQLRRDIDADVRALMNTSSFLDRIRGTGPLRPERAREHGALGPIGKGSGYADDARDHRPYDGYALLDHPDRSVSEVGDAQARLVVRWAEVEESFGLLAAAVDALDGLGGTALRVPVPAVDGRGIGWAEAPQGEVVYVVEIADGRLTRCKPRSASFHNLPLFHEVFAGDILTDFPFIEASFGLSIAGVAL